MHTLFFFFLYLSCNFFNLDSSEQFFANKSTIRSLLSAEREFVYDWFKLQTWFLTKMKYELSLRAGSYK